MDGYYFMENAIKMDDDWGYPYDSGNFHFSPGGLVTIDRRVVTKFYIYYSWWLY